MNNINRLFFINTIILLSFFATGLYISIVFLEFSNPFTAAAYDIFDIVRLKKIPISDTAENISGALFINQGLIPYENFAFNHLPGLQIYLAAFLRLFGHADIVAGDLTYYSIFFFSYFATALFQLIIFYSTFKRYYNFSNNFILLFLGFYTLYYLIYCNFITPLSEMFIVPMVFAASSQIFLSMNKKLNIDLFELLIAMFIFFVANMIGLTELPFFILYLLIIIFYYFKHSQKGNYLKLKSSGGLLFFFLISISLLFSIDLINIDISKMWYWNFNFSKTYVHLDLFERLINYFDYMLSSRFFKFGQTAPILAETNFYFYLFFVPFLFLMRKHWPVILIFILLLGSFHWRVHEGYKLYPLLGFNLALIGSVITNKQIANNQLSFYYSKYFSVILFLGVILSLFFLVNMKFNKEFENELNERYAACSVRQRPNLDSCNCFIQDFWDTSFYLKNNLYPCEDNYPSQWPMTHFFNKERLIKVYESRKFLLRSEINRYYDDIPSEIDQIYESLYCENYDYNSKLCYYKNK